MIPDRKAVQYSLLRPGSHGDRMKCIVTGATGHIGCVLVRELCRKGYDVTAFVLPGDSAEAICREPVKLITGDICSPYDTVRAFRGFDLVFHLAGMISIGSAGRRQMERVNVEGTRNVIRACKIAHVKRLVYASSVHAIEEPAKGSSVAETKQFDPQSVKGAYAKTKAAATKLVLEAAKNGLDAVVVHPSGVIGPYEYSLSNIGQLMADTIGGSLKAYINGAYNFVDVRDVARGIRLAGEKGKRGECYILSGEVVTVKEMLDIITETAAKKPVKAKLPYWFALATAPLSELYYKAVKRKPLYTAYSVYTLRTNCHFNCSKAVKELGYRFRPAAESLADAVNWMLSNGKRLHPAV